MRNPLFKNKSLRILASVIIIVVFIIIVLLSVFITARLHKNNGPRANNGYVDLSNMQIKDAPIYLNGKWEYFSGDALEEGTSINDTSFEGYQSFPIASIVQAKKNASYRIYFSLPKGNLDDLNLFIPTFDGELSVYLNGAKQEQVEQDVNWVSDALLKTRIKLNNFVPQSDWQELVISGNFDELDITLFKRPIILSTEYGISMISTYDGANQGLLLGILLMVLINGFVFMLIRPNHRIISIMTIFDATILLHIIFFMDYVIAFIRAILPGLVITDVMCVALSVFSLMVGGSIGCILATIIFDPDRKAPQWLVAPFPILYAIYALIFPLNLGFFEKIGVYLLIVTYIFTFVGVAVEFYYCIKSTQKKGYYSFQMIKTMYIGVVILIDLVFWNVYIDFTTLIYIFGIFFIMHVIVRLYDNNESYHEVETLNKTLEATVEERTKELLEANKVLSELSIRDPLTKAFNRLHFEKMMELAFSNAAENAGDIHVCMMDLDFFKNVNDTYGHDAGDQQLKYLVSTVNHIVKDDAMFARIGGEEFILLFQDKSDEYVYECVDQIRNLLEDNAKENKKMTTASFGIAKWDGKESSKSLLKQADVALYKAKDKGRDCIVVNEKEI